MSQFWAWVLLALGAFRLLIMANLYRPVTRPGVLNLLSFFTGWLTGELMHYILALECVITLALAQAGALDQPIGQLGMMLTVLAWFGFHLHLLSSKEVADVTECALQITYGKRYRDQIEPAYQERFTQHIPRRTQWLPFYFADPKVECIPNITYHEGDSLRLDIYRPKGTTDADKLPILLQIHGGAWAIGSKDHQGLPLMYHMAARGWVCVAINYRLSPRAAFPDHLIDVKRAIKWLREEGHGYGGDPSMLVITGGSAGGHLATLAALSPNDPKYQPDFPDVDTSVTACVPFYAPYDLSAESKYMRHSISRWFISKLVFKTTIEAHPERFIEASPLYQINPDAPPFFVLHGDTDSLADIADTRRFVEKLRDTSQQPVSFAELPRTQHAFDVFYSRRSLLAVYAVDRYLALLQSQHKAPKALPPSGEIS